MSASQFFLIFILGLLTVAAFGFEQPTDSPEPTLIIEPVKPPESPSPIPVNQCDEVIRITSTSGGRFAAHSSNYPKHDAHWRNASRKIANNSFLLCSENGGEWSSILQFRDKIFSTKSIEGVGAMQVHSSPVVISFVFP